VSFVWRLDCVPQLMFTTQSGVQDNSPAHRAGRSGRPSVPPEPASTALSLIDHTGAVESGRFSPDGRRIVSDGWDKTLRESHTADAARRTRAPSPTPRPPPAPPGTLMHVQSGTPTALTCRSPAPRAGPAPRYALPGDPPTSGRAFRTRYAGPATLAAPPRAQLLLPRVPGHRPTAKLNRTLRSVNVAGWPRGRGRRSPRTPRGWGLPRKSASRVWHRRNGSWTAATRRRQSRRRQRNGNEEGHHAGTDHGWVGLTRARDPP